MPVIETSPLILLAVAIAAYLLGSIPFGLVVSKLFSLPDPRTIGSNNIGATNVLRSGSKPAALATVLLDGAKGFFAVVVGCVFGGEDAMQIAALCAFLGHVFPIWLNFKGGKGVATLLGALVGLAPLVGFIALLAWLFTFFVFRYSSLSALMSALVTTPVAVILGFQSMAAVLVVLTIMLFWRHSDNIKRLGDGTEQMVTWDRQKSD